MTKVIKKPSYLGTSIQVSYQEAVAGAEGGYADRHSAARRAVGQSLTGQVVALVRVAGSKHVIPHYDAPSLPMHIRPFGIYTVEHCDNDGAIFLAPTATV